MYWLGMLCVFVLKPWVLPRPPRASSKLHVIISQVVIPVIDVGTDSYLINLESVLFTNIDTAVLLFV